MLRTARTVKSEIVEIMYIGHYQYLPKLLAEYKKLIDN